MDQDKDKEEHKIIPGRGNEVPHFINQTEAACFAENAALTEVITANGITTVYSGTPSIKDPAKADSGTWTISRTVVTTNAQTKAIMVETRWGKGRWEDRDKLNYNYI